MKWKWRFDSGLAPLLAEGVREDRRAGPQRRQRERRDAGGLSGGDADVGDAEAAVGEHLRDDAAERVADDDRLLGQLADDPLVVVGDLLEADPLERLGVVADVFDGAVVDSGPARDDDLVAGGAEAVGPGVPALGGHPEAVDEDDGGLGRGGHFNLLVGVCGGFVLSFSFRILFVPAGVI